MGGEQLAESHGIFDSAAQRNAWEAEFAATFVDPVLPRVQQAAKNIISGTPKGKRSEALKDAPYICRDEASGGYRHAFWMNGMRGAATERKLVLRQLDEDVRLSEDQRGWKQNLLCVFQRPSFAGLKQVLNSDPQKADAHPFLALFVHCLLYTSPSPRDQRGSRMPSSA